MHIKYNIFPVADPRSVHTQPLQETGTDARILKKQKKKNEFIIIIYIMPILYYYYCYVKRGSVYKRATVSTLLYGHRDDGTVAAYTTRTRGRGYPSVLIGHNHNMIVYTTHAEP